ncbi:MAG: vitamin B12 dependent-methionine synthase activation domain-containing protein [FCB group bacterium]|jgi:hypothetical protein|nr:vitamin B12 dependent-methionine synthase activation domain-containing protein [FCB group bacterium]
MNERLYGNTIDDVLQGMAVLYESAIPFVDLGIEPFRVEIAMGYAPGAMPEPFHELVDTAVAEAAQRLSPRCGFLVLPSSEVEVGETGLRLRGEWFETGDTIAGLLESASAGAIFAATAGPELDEWARGYFNDGDPMTGFVVDALGSVTAERSLDWLEERLLDLAGGIGWSVTHQYGPGYCGWHLSEQHKLFGLLPPRFLGIALSESALMRPVKSVSGFIGLGPNAERKPHGCAICTMEHCFRRSPAAAV